MRRRLALTGLPGFLFGLTVLSRPGPADAAVSIPEALRRRFAYLSTHGNSNCTITFQNAVATMPPMRRLQGSCCAPMVLTRYVAQIEGLRKYHSVPEIPADPYDIPVGLAQFAMRHYAMNLTPLEQAEYHFAMAHAREHGPCCCRCGRWQAYGGLSKYLIRHRDFTGAQVTEIWGLSDGCGGND
jgi:hypothetical protein